MGIQRFVFYSIHNCENHPEVPLMEIKRCTEKYIADSGLNYTIIRLCGFMQVRVEHDFIALTARELFSMDVVVLSWKEV